MHDERLDPGFPDPGFPIQLFQNKVVILAKAARIADRPLAEFIQILGVMGIDVVDYDPDELERDLKNLDNDWSLGRKSGSPN